jgi:hypothetical protein
MSSESDASVLRRSIDQPDCFGALFDRHFGQAYRYLHRRLGDELAAELAAETFLQAFRSRRRFSGGEASTPGRSGRRWRWRSPICRLPPHAGDAERFDGREADIRRLGQARTSGSARYPQRRRPER